MFIKLIKIKELEGIEYFVARIILCAYLKKKNI